MNEKRTTTRRSFLKTTTGVMAGAIAVPIGIPGTALGLAGRAAPSERVTLGAIGVGPQGNGVLGGFLAQRDVHVIAICDVKTWARERTKRRVENHYKAAGCAAYNDFRDLVDRDDIDVVSSATCDHWHVLTALAAVKSGKDVYLEKPMGLCLTECWALREACHRYGRIFQFGTQQRSSAKFRLACEIARNQKIGKLHTINVWSPGSSPGGSTEQVPVPKGLDYDLWLGPAPYTPHTKNRTNNSTWWFVSDYALGFIAGWGIHPVDIAVWGGGDLLNCPVTVEGTGQFPAEGLHDTAVNWRITLKYQSGITLNFAGHPRPDEWTRRYEKTTSHGTAFEGSAGWVHVHRGIINSNPAALATTKLGPNDTPLYRSPQHQRNLIDCVKSRKQAVSNIDESVRSETICQISEIAIRLGRKVTWDPKVERFVNDGEANRMLSRAMRSPWRL